MKNSDSDARIALHQFLVCERFATLKDDGYLAEGVRSNLYAPRFPYHFKNLFVVTCWRKDTRFHKEVIEYVTDYGKSYKTPHMDIEPITNNVLFRWHTHSFPSHFTVDKPTTLRIRVILDWELCFESYLLLEKRPG